MKVQLSRKVEIEGVEFSGIISEADAPLGILQSIIGSGWGVEVRVAPKKSVATKVAATEPEESDEDGDDDVSGTAIATLAISKTAVQILKKAEIETIEQAAEYIAEHGALNFKGLSQAAIEVITAAINPQA